MASTEIGYKGLFLGKKLFVDAYAYYNKYNGFQAVQLVAQLAEDTGEEEDLLYQIQHRTFSSLLAEQEQSLTDGHDPERGTLLPGGDPL